VPLAARAPSGPRLARAARRSDRSALRPARPVRSLLALLVLALVAGLWLSNAVPVIVSLTRGLTYQRPAAAPVEPTPPRTDAELEARVRTAATLPQGLVGAVVIDLGSGSEARVNDDQTFPAASLFKLPIVVETLNQERQGRLTPDTQLAITADAWADGSGVLQARVGDRLPVRELLRLMVQESDNIAALVLLDALGVDNVNATMAGLGLRKTQLRDHRAGDDTPHTTTASDMASLLEAIATGHLFDATSSEQALQLLELRQANAWLSEDLPFWVRVAHKWGDLPEARHDAGIVFTPEGSYVAVVLTQGARPEAAERAIADIGRAGFDGLLRHGSP
jgi:beta-lactamase class A